MADHAVAHAVTGEGAHPDARGIVKHGRQPLRHAGLDDRRRLTAYHPVAPVEDGVDLARPERAQGRVELVHRGDLALDELYLDRAGRLPEGGQ